MIEDHRTQTEKRRNTIRESCSARLKLEQMRVLKQGADVFKE